MIELERHIEVLLLDNDCVIIPGLGGFMTHNLSARYDEEELMFLPPQRTLGFNPSLQINDSLLVQSYIEAYDFSYPEALRRIESEVKELVALLKRDGFYELNNIGVLRLDSDGVYTFEPSESGILTPELYGLTSVDFPLLQADAVAPKREPKKAKLKVPDPDSMRLNVRLLRAAAVAVVTIVSCFTLLYPEQTGNGVIESGYNPLPIAALEKQKASHRPAPIVVEEKIDSASVAVVAVKKDTVVKSGPVYSIVLASQVSERNAQAFASKLEKQGLTDVSLNRTNNILRVVYGSYKDAAEAREALRILRQSHGEFAEAWVREFQ